MRVVIGLISAIFLINGETLAEEALSVYRCGNIYTNDKTSAADPSSCRCVEGCQAPIVSLPKFNIREHKISTCGKKISILQKSVAAELRDPESVKFGECKLVNFDAACLSFNAKNGFGGYAGARFAALRLSDGRWEYVGGIPGDVMQCIEFVAR